MATRVTQDRIERFQGLASVEIYRVTNLYHMKGLVTNETVIGMDLYKSMAESVEGLPREKGSYRYLRG